jgi:hypothetical protein
MREIGSTAKLKIEERRDDKKEELEKIKENKQAP